MMKKYGNSTWINLDDVRSLFSEEEIEARKKEIIEEMELKRKKDFEAKELLKQERKERKDKGWTSSIIRPERQTEIEAITEEIVEELVEEIIEEEKPEEKDEIEAVIEDRKLASQELRTFADELNNETNEIEILKSKHPEWILKYLEEEGGQAIWRGVITKGFRNWCSEKGYTLGE